LSMIISSSPSLEWDEDIYILETKSGSYTFKLRVADTLYKQSLGLMHIKTMPIDCGMIFINPTPMISKFWMKNTYIPLDIVFLDEAYKTIYIHKDAKPHDESHISSLIPTKYIIEVNSGTVDATGLTIGSRFAPHN
ncbi:MAG: DUF192 domain-containing protein, partial [Alphaproteobacteria bacterium]